MPPEPAVEIALYDCEHCGATTGPTFHDGDGCEGPVLHIDGTWQCGRCGARIRSTAACADCGREIEPTPLETPLDRRPAATPRAIERAVHEGTNRRRRDHGVGTLSYSDHLSAIALQHSRDMASREYFDHDSPEGESADGRYRRFGHDDRSVGENIAFHEITPTVDADALADRVVDGWMDSPGHRENLLRGQFDEEGIGVFCDPDGTVYVTQNFR